MEQVAVYDLAYKICGAACIPLQTINTALFPYNAKNKYFFCEKDVVCFDCFRGRFDVNNCIVC